jgi:hypothetical protein
MPGRPRQGFERSTPGHFGVVVWAILCVVVVVAVIAAVKVSGIVSHHHPAGAVQTSPKQAPVAAPVNTPQTPPQAASVQPSGPDVTALRAAFDQLQSSVDATIGIAIAPAGGAASPISLGQWVSGPAWSTIKIPLVIAALRKAEPPQITDEMRAAITESDNAAAESIWEGLGDPVTAAHKVEEVLRETRDPTTVEWRKLRPQFTAFGQTQWSLIDQVQFAAFMACDDRDAQVRTLMSQITQDQRWGLGVIPNTEFKGGWGPYEAGPYLVRQFGLVTNTSGAVSAVAVAVQPAGGSFADGIADLNRICTWLSEHIAMLPTGRCGR